MCNKKATNFVMVWIWSSLHKGMCLKVLVPENGSIPWDVIDHEGSEWMNGFIPWWTHNLMALLGGDGNFPIWGLVEGSMLLGVPMAVATHLFSDSLSPGCCKLMSFLYISYHYAKPHAQSRQSQPTREVIWSVLFSSIHRGSNHLCSLVWYRNWIQNALFAVVIIFMQSILQN